MSRFVRSKTLIGMPLLGNIVMIVVLFGVWGCHSTPPVATCNATHAEPRREPMQVLKEADALAAKGRAREALEQYIWLLDHGHEFDPPFLAVRNTRLVDSILALGKTYEPARLELRRRQQSLENGLATALPSVREDEAWLFVRLNDKFGETERTKRTLERLPSTAEYSGIRTILIRASIEGFLASGDQAFVVAHYVAIRTDLDRQGEYLRQDRDRLVHRASMVYALLLKSGRSAEANKMADLALDVDSSSGTFRELLKSASDQARDLAVQELLAKAKERLPATESAMLERQWGAAAIAAPPAPRRVASSRAAWGRAPCPSAQARWLGDAPPPMRRDRCTVTHPPAACAGPRSFSRSAGL
jgi:hypothetical protein